MNGARRRRHFASLYYLWGRRPAECPLLFSISRKTLQMRASVEVEIAGRPIAIPTGRMGNARRRATVALRYVDDAARRVDDAGRSVDNTTRRGRNTIPWAQPSRCEPYDMYRRATSAAGRIAATGDAQDISQVRATVQGFHTSYAAIASTGLAASIRWVASSETISATAHNTDAINGISCAPTALIPTAPMTPAAVTPR